MVRYILKRILLLIPVLIAVSLLVFVLMDLAPGDRVATMVAQGAELTEEEVAALRTMFGYDRTVFYRYGLYMIGLLQGNLGVSEVTGIDVWELFLSRLPYTLALSAGALIIGAGVSIPLGIRAAKRAGTLTDNVTTTFTLIGMSMPSFWLGILLILIFSHYLGWFPAGGARHGFRSFVLPAIGSGFMLMALSTRQTRSSMLEVLNADYLRTARSKGVPESAVIRKHALGNAWIPIVTTIGSSISATLAGSAVIESVFTWPGIGRMVVDAVNQRDVTTVTGTVILTSIIYVLVQLFVDVAYAVVDPRIKAEYRKKSTRRKKLGALGKQPSAPDDAQDSLGSMAGVHAEAAGVAAETADATYGAVYAKPQETALPQPPDSGKIDGFQSVQSAVVSGGAATTVIAEAAPSDAVPAPQIEITRDHVVADGAGVAAAADSNELITKKHKKRSQLSEVFHHLRSNRGAIAGLIIITSLIIVLIITLFISFDTVIDANMRARLTSPGREFPFGTDHMGRNMFLRVIYGTRYSLGIGLGAATVQAFIGVILGTIAGYYGKLADEIIMRFSDALASIPSMLLGMVIVTALGQSFQNLIIAVAIPGIPVYIRITRASILSLKGHEFVEASRAIGLSNINIMFKQVLPNGLAPIIVTFTTSLGITILVAASLSFLGFGVPVPHPEWGALIAGGREFIRVAPWITTFPGLFIMITVLAFNLLGDGLRDALDPKLKK